MKEILLIYWKWTDEYTVWKLIEIKCLISRNKVLLFGIELKNYLRIIIWQLLDYKPGHKMRAGQQAILGQKLYSPVMLMSYIHSHY